MPCSCSYNYEIHEKIKGTRKYYDIYLGLSVGSGPRCNVPAQFNPSYYVKKISQNPSPGPKDQYEIIEEQKTVPENAGDACPKCSCGCTPGQTRIEPPSASWETVEKYKEKIRVNFQSRVKYKLTDAAAERDDNCGDFKEEHEVDVKYQEKKFTRITPYSCKCTCNKK